MKYLAIAMEVIAISSILMYAIIFLLWMMQLTGLFVTPISNKQFCLHLMALAIVAIAAVKVAKLAGR